MSDTRVYRVMLGEREVLLREMKIRDQRLAMQAVGNRAGDNKFLFLTMMQEELLKLLLHSVAGEKVDQAKLNDLDSLFTVAEYTKLQSVVAKISGMEDFENTPLIESVFISKT
jgi:hypothetical protein